MDQTGARQRVDIWLWHARFFKTRTLSTKLVRAGKVRLNGIPIRKAKVEVTVGDILTFPQAKIIRIAKITAIGQRRGPAVEAQTLYEDLTPPREEMVKVRRQKVAVREVGSGRPTKAERRATDRLRNMFPD